jgi:hypothetical protein
MHSLTDAKKQPLLSCERDFLDHHRVRTLDPLCLVAVFLSLVVVARRRFIDGRQSWRKKYGRPEITELAVGSKRLGNLTSVELQSSPLLRQLAE